jgi:hypothetical protein
MKSLIGTISTAFESRRYPGDESISRCTYDKRNGGTYDGPCWECQEMAEYFKGKPWMKLTGHELRRYGDNDALFTVPAYCRESYRHSVCLEQAELYKVFQHYSSQDLIG